MLRRCLFALLAVFPVFIVGGETQEQPEVRRQFRIYLASMKQLAGVSESDRDAFREMIRIRLVARGFKVVLAESPAEGETCDSECVADEASNAEADFSLVVVLAKLESDYIVTAELTEIEGGKTALARTFRVKASALDDTSIRIAGLVHEKTGADRKGLSGSTTGLQINRKFSEETTFVSAVGGIIFPGLGHILIGEGKEGALFATGWIGFLYYFVGIASPHYVSASKRLRDLNNDSFMVYTLARSTGYDPIAANPASAFFLYQREEQLREDSLNKVRRETAAVYAGAVVYAIGSLVDLFLHHLLDVQIVPESKGSEVKVGFKVKY